MLGKLSQYMLIAALLMFGCNTSEQNEIEIPEGKGIAWLYPGDDGIGDHPSVVFSDNFEDGDITDLETKWGHISNREGQVVFFSDDVPNGSAGKRSLRMTATRGENEGGELYKAFSQGWDKIYLRFYTKFAEDHGNYHHFVALRGFKNPLPYPMGGAGQLAENHFSVTVEPSTHEVNIHPSIRHSPPGIWQFYAYWPEMRSWQTEEGKPDGRPNPYYGNSLQPQLASVIPRGEWICVEMMLKLNSSPDEMDGELALWIDGEQIVEFSHGNQYGYWINDRFRNDPEHEDAKPFEGFRWRHDMDVKINVLRLQHYVSDRAFESSQNYSENNTDFLINTEQATVWFDNVVMAKEYIGPIRLVGD